MSVLSIIPFHFEYLPRKRKYLTTNIIGDYLYLSKEELTNIINQPIETLPQSLVDKVSDVLLGEKNSIDTIVNHYRNSKAFLSQGPSLHIVVVTLQCQLQCLYCHASAECSNPNLHMTKDVAEKTISFIMNSKSDEIAIEFQGGEPLMNWEVIEYFVERTLEINKTKNKNLIFRLVSNFESLTDDKLAFLKKHNVGICTSLDGPKELHEVNRPYHANSNFDTISHWLHKIHREYPDYHIGALTTVTKKSFSFAKDIIDTYRDHHIDSVFLRPLNPIGRAEKAQDITYTPQDFFEFYKSSLDYIIELNKKGIHFSESTLEMFLTKLLLKVDAGFVDLCSPCGAGIRNLAYDYNGDIYTCDEGRMLGKLGDKRFSIGTVDDVYNDVIQSEPVCHTLQSSCLEGKPYCHQCVYKPYCGVCPVYNVKQQGNMFGDMSTNDRCSLQKLLFSYYFSLLDDSETHSILSRWVLTPSDKKPV